jgi:hypothetical protein
LLSLPLTHNPNPGSKLFCLESPLLIKRSMTFRGIKAILVLGLSFIGNLVLENTSAPISGNKRPTSVQTPSMLQTSVNSICDHQISN